MKMDKLLHRTIAVLGVLYFIRGLYAFKNKSDTDGSDFYFDDLTDSSSKSSLFIGNTGNPQKRRAHHSAWSQEVQETGRKDSKRKFPENLDTGQQSPDISTLDFKKLLQYLVSILQTLNLYKDNHDGSHHRNKHEDLVNYNKSKESQTEKYSSKNGRTDIINGADIETLTEDNSDHYRDQKYVPEHNKSSRIKFGQERRRNGNKNSTLRRKETSDESKPTANGFTTNSDISYERKTSKPIEEKLYSTQMPHINESNDAIHRTSIQKFIAEYSFTEEYVPIHSKSKTDNENTRTTTVLPTVRNYSLQSKNNESSPRRNNPEIDYKQEIKKQTVGLLPGESTDNESVTTKADMEHDIFLPQIEKNVNVKKHDMTETSKISNEYDRIANSTSYDHTLQVMDSDADPDYTLILDEEKSSEEVNLSQRQKLYLTSTMKTVNVADSFNLKKHDTAIYELEDEDDESKEDEEDDKEQNTESSNYSKQLISEDISYEYCDCYEYDTDEESNDHVEKKDVEELLDLIDYVEEVMRNTTGDPRSTTDIPSNTTEVPQHIDFSQNTTEVPQKTADILQNTTHISQNMQYELRVTTDFPRNTTDIPRNATTHMSNKTDPTQHTTDVLTQLVLPLTSRKQTKNTENIKPKITYETILDYIYKFSNHAAFKGLREEREKTERKTPVRNI